MTTPIFLFILIAAPFVAYIFWQKSKIKDLPDEQVESDTFRVDDETGQKLHLIPYPYSPWTKSRVVFLEPGQIEWWNNLSPSTKKEIWNNVQNQIKNGELQKVFNDDGELIGLSKC